MLGTVLGIGAFIAVVGLSATAGGQIDKRFTALAATSVSVEDVARTDASGLTTLSFPADASDRVRQVDGVVDGGVYWALPVQNPRIAGSPTQTGGSSGLALYAADPGAIAAMRPHVTAGRVFDGFHQAQGARVAIVGRAAAQRLGIRRLDALPAVFVNDIPYTVIGVFDDLQRVPELLLSIIIPTSTALAAYGPPVDQPARMLVETQLGAAPVVAGQLAVALRPEAPESFKIIAPPDPKTLRHNVTGDFDALFLLLAALSLVVGAVGIANTTLVAVMERIAEIGLRRSLGARARHIAAQFLAESALIGSFGGLIGSSLGVVIVLAVAIARHWTAVLPPWAAVSAPLAGAVVGVIAGLYPAIRATKIEPVEALRR
ncbi:putative ABC transport system permease protein [Hamadaea flava]|uniref:ABC transporter permease n=1 Tax=Hamadaea flava TaxID=1742688 RepID=A0ABV8LXE1_9ACTN|nr:ABC transporter permease [Hamadaea flava]MCP2327016.1 putative ABC transport system permease protein [Hamadaea flava]